MSGLRALGFLRVEGFIALGFECCRVLVALREANMAAKKGAGPSRLAYF